jgi:hypothetical protein
VTNRRCPAALAFCALVAAVASARAARAADPTIGDCLAASEASLALRNQHKLRDARAQLLICSAPSCPGDVRSECTRRVAAVNAAIPTIVFETKDADGNDLGGVKMTVDGGPGAERLDGTAIALDPGEHAFSFRVAGQPALHKRFLIHEGEKGRHERIVLGAPPAPPPALPRATADATTAGGTQSPTTTATTTTTSDNGGGSDRGAQGTAALATMGIGAIALGVGIGFGVDSFFKHRDAQQVCPAADCPDQHGVDLWNSARSAGNIATGAFIVGAVGLAGGAVLWFTATPEPRRTASATTVGLGPGGFSVKGSW